MGERTIRRHNDAGRATKEKLTFLSIAAAIVLPVLLAVALVAMDMRADLSELKSTARVDENGAQPMAWPRLKERAEISGRVRMLGYMMDEQRRVRDGERVNTFVLLPEAGHFLRPAQRIPDQMVVVWSSHPVVFRNRRLVWVSGTLERTIRRSGEDQPEYAMIFAQVSPAAAKDIGIWFQP